MYNDENREFDPVGGDLPPQPQQDRTDLPEEEPDEIVSWYTPRQEEPEEVVNYFVQQRPIPQNVWKQAAKTQHKRRRLWTWLGIGGIALVVVVIVVAAILSSTASSAPSLPGSDDGDSASSMVDIFRKKETTIPRISGEEGVKLSCQEPSGEELTIQQVYAKVNPSVVAVVAEQSDGSAAVGPTEIDGETHFFTPKGMEVILVNAAHPIPSYYTVNPVIVVDWHRVDQRCYEPLMQMLSDCSGAGIEYIFNCGYRTMQEQTDILEKRTQEHMKEFDLDFDEARKKALETVAVPGTSEHQMGLAVDISGEDAHAWLAEHCWEYGFILRYTEDKAEITGITNEPWHFRYVGREISMDMKDSGLCLEEYLGAA